MPEPDVIVVATGSGGTAAGLAVGLEREGMRTRVTGVAISQPVPVVSLMARRLVKKTGELAGLSRARIAGALERLVVEGRWLGRGYGHPTPEGQAAVAEAARRGLVLDETYTAKAFACALDVARGGRGDVLFWHTLSSAPMEPLDAEGAELPPEIARLFR